MDNWADESFTLEAGAQTNVWLGELLAGWINGVMHEATDKCPGNEQMSRGDGEKTLISESVMRR